MSTVAAACPACGFSVAPGFRFCGGCGKEQPGGAAPTQAREAERRHVCVLFCDLVGSTALSQQLDPEDLRDLVEAYQQACGSVVLRHGGYVAQYLGDGIVVYFGYPHAHEDDPLRAVRCGLEMLTAVDRLAASTGRPLQVRIGIHSGRVVVGALGSNARAEPVAVGETPNIAARVQGEAQPGQVVVSDALWRLLGGAFATQALGERALKGVDRPLGLFRVLGPAEGDPLDGSRRTPFIGRDRERERVLATWQRALQAQPQFVLLRGEAGIGKTRLLAVVRRVLADQDTLVLSARCTPFTTDTALYPFVELLSVRLGLAGIDSRQQVARIAERVRALGLDAAEAVPLLAAALAVPVDAAEWPAPEMSPVRARQRTLDVLVDAYHALASRRPMLLVVEDLHWADASSLELLRQLVASPRRSALMVMLTARPEFTPTWGDAGNVTALTLEALTAAESERFIRMVANDKPLPPELLWRIRERAAGNPLFLEEITRAVIESGALVEGEHSWQRVGGPASEAVPASMEASLMARIDRLGDARALFQLGAVLGREFSHPLLLAVSDLPEAVMQAQLDAILPSGLLLRQGGGASAVYTFKHALVQDVARDSLLRSTRQRHHARIAEVLPARFPELVETRPEFLAHHFSGAGNHAEAAVQWRAAGENASRRCAVNEAVAHLRRALADLAALPEDAARMDQELAVLTALAPALMAARGWAAQEVGETCSRAIDLAGRLGAHDRMYAPLWGLWTNQFVGGRLREGIATAEQVLAMALASGDPLLEVTGRHAVAYTRFYRGEYAAALAESAAGLRHFDFEREQAIAETFQLSSSVSILAAKGGGLWMQGAQDEGLAAMDEMLALARRLRHPATSTSALAFCMMFTLYDRDWARLFELAEQVDELARAEGFALWVACAGLYRGRARIGLGQVERGVAEVLEWGALFRQTGSGCIDGSTTGMHSEALHLAGRSDEALAVSADGERRAAAGEVGVMVPDIHRIRGGILRALGRREDAERAVAQAVASARAQGALSLELRALTDRLELRLDEPVGHSGSDSDSGGCRAAADDLRRVLAAMPCSADRPDLVAARAVLARAVLARGVG